MANASSWWNQRNANRPAAGRSDARRARAIATTHADATAAAVADSRVRNGTYWYTGRAVTRPTTQIDAPTSETKGAVRQVPLGTARPTSAASTDTQATAAGAATGESRSSIRVAATAAAQATAASASRSADSARRAATATSKTAPIPAAAPAAAGLSRSETSTTARYRPGRTAPSIQSHTPPGASPM